MLSELVTGCFQRIFRHFGIFIRYQEINSIIACFYSQYYIHSFAVICIGVGSYPSSRLFLQIRALCRMDIHVSVLSI